MFKAERINVKYIKFGNEKFNYDFGLISDYINNGYYVTFGKNGEWSILATAEVIVVIDCGINGKFVHNMKSQILKMYNRKKVSQKLVYEFESDFRLGKIEILVNKERCSVRVISN